jgi:hypothetical protein
MENGHKLKEPMLCLTMCAYRREGMGEEEYRNYMTNIHAPFVQGLMVKHGIDKYSMVSGMTLLHERERKSACQLGLLVFRPVRLRGTPCYDLGLPT